MMRALTLALLALTACSASASPSASPAEGATHDPATHNPAHDWGYMGEGAPEHWGELSSEYAKCAEGSFQSPIDLRPIARADVDALTISYQPDALRIVDNGHTVQVNHQAQSVLRVGDVLAMPLTMPADRIAQFREHYAANARPVQPRAGACLAPHMIGETQG